MMIDMNQIVETDRVFAMGALFEGIATSRIRDLEIRKRARDYSRKRKSWRC